MCPYQVAKRGFERVVRATLGIAANLPPAQVKSKFENVRRTIIASAVSEARSAQRVSWKEGSHLNAVKSSNLNR